MNKSCHRFVIGFLLPVFDARQSDGRNSSLLSQNPRRVPAAHARHRETAGLKHMLLPRNLGLKLDWAIVIRPVGLDASANPWATWPDNNPLHKASKVVGLEW